MGYEINGNVPAWLRSLVEAKRNSASLLDRAVGLATLVRSWSTPFEGRRDLRDMIILDPTADLKEWWKNNFDHSEVVEVALDEAISLLEELERFPKMIGDLGGVEMHGIALSWLHRRDDLQSILYLSRACGFESYALDASLDGLDEQGESHLTFWSMFSFRGDPRLRSVSWQDPDAWWGQLAIPRQLRIVKL